MTYARKVGFYGFDISRIVQLIGASHNLDYLDEETTQFLLNRIGNLSEKMFENWENFMASCILGEQYTTMVDGINGEFIIPSKN